MTPHSKSEAKRLAVMQRVTWFATCECTGVEAGMRMWPDSTERCRVCAAPYLAVPHIVEDRIRADERNRVCGGIMTWLNEQMGCVDIRATQRANDDVKRARIMLRAAVDAIKTPP